MKIISGDFCLGLWLLRLVPLCESHAFFFGHEAEAEVFDRCFGRWERVRMTYHYVYLFLGLRHVE